MNQSYRVNPEILRAMQLNLCTTPNDAEKIASQGSQALIASNYLEQMIKMTGGTAAFKVVEFIKSNICRFQYCATERFTIRFFDLTDNGDSEGVEMEVKPLEKLIIFRRFTGLYGVATPTGVEEVKYA